MSDVERIQFILFPANACMKTMPEFGLELQACVCKQKVIIMVLRQMSVNT